MKINHFHLKKVGNVMGFSLNTAGEGETVRVLTKAVLTSDENDFYTFIEQISQQYFSRIGVFTNAVYQFIILIHNNLSADIYINDFPLLIEVMAIRNLRKGEFVTNKDIADIKKIIFKDIDLLDTDKVIFCGKVGWKFVLFFDLDRSKTLNIDKVWSTLGEVYRYLSFQYIYKLLESDTHFKEMSRDGWFPFIELVAAEDYKTLSEAYKHKRFQISTIDSIINNFDKKRIEKITDRWWNKPIFKEKKSILMAGINAFLRGDDEGNITSIKTLLPEIEGIIRIQYFSDTGKDKRVNTINLLEFIAEKGKAKVGSDYSLLFPLPFFNYLKDEVFADFDLRNGKVKLSRHSSSHGVVNAEEYTKIKALQMVLILDQISFYI
jgi:hypothetical protein